MSTEAQSNPQPANPGSPAATPVVQPAPQGSAPPATATPPRDAAPPAGQQATPPESASVTLSTKELKARLDRATSAQLKKLFGTDNQDEIVKLWKDREQLAAKEEERRRNELSQTQRLEEDIRKEKELRLRAEAQLKTIEHSRIAEKETSRLKDIAGKFIDTRYFKHVGRDFAEHLKKNYTDAQMAKLTDKDIARWFHKYAQENPIYARKAASPPAEPTPVNNGTPRGNVPPSPPPGTPTGKDVRPGRPNSMSEEEWRRYKKEKGISY